MSSISKDYIFTKKDDKLHFIGDFDALYNDEDNPWGQDGTDTRLGEYYKYSRKNILEKLTYYPKHKKMLEVGCGLGYVVDFFNKNSDFTFDGADISSIAIEKAKKNFPEYNFLNLDIQEDNLKIEQKYDIILINQVYGIYYENLIVFL